MVDAVAALRRSIEIPCLIQVRYGGKRWVARITPRFFEKKKKVLANLLASDRQVSFLSCA